MSDSLRDQLMKAGFKDAAPEPRKAQKKARVKGSEKRQQGSSHRQKHQSSAAISAGGKPVKAQSTKARDAAEEAARLAQKKAIKEKIKALIETHRVKEHVGSVAFSYQLGSRVKQLFVTDECQKKLASGELLITRLNGNTFLIPPNIAEEITALNPDWALITAGDQSSESKIDAAYAEYQVPDDLNW